MRHLTPAVKLTYDSLLRLPDDGMRHELIDGAHYVTASPNLKHQVVLGNLHLAIGSWLEFNPIGRVVLSPFDVVFSNVDVLVPDLLFITAGKQAEALTPRNVRGAPDLVVEIASDSTRQRDKTLKHRLYERSGVPEYWIVDPVGDRVVVDRLEGNRYRRVEVLTRAGGDVLQSPLMPGLLIPLARVFRDT